MEPNRCQELFKSDYKDPGICSNTKVLFKAGTYTILANSGK